MVNGDITYKQERLATVYAEMFPLLERHYFEISSDLDIPLSPDQDCYYNMENAGVLRIYTSRDLDYKIIGYAVFFVRHNPHYKTSLQAVQDVLYIDPDCRGFGADFISWCEAQLKLEGVQKVFHHVKVKHNWGKLLERMGYDHVEHIYAKRLDK